MPSDAEYAAIAYGRGDYSPEVRKLITGSNRSIAALLAWVNRLEDLFRRSREEAKTDWLHVLDYETLPERRKFSEEFDQGTERLIAEAKESVT